jgi:hypothetical protein
MTFVRDGVTLGVREYAESYLVYLNEVQIADDKIVDVGGERRFVLEATNEGGHNSTLVDLKDLLLWLHDHRVDLLAPIAEMMLKDDIDAMAKETNDAIDAMAKETNANIDTLKAEFNALSEEAFADFEAGRQTFLQALVAVGVTQDQLTRASEITVSKLPKVAARAAAGTPPAVKE